MTRTLLPDDPTRPMPNVLIIDDNPAVATALETLLSLHDVDSRAVTTPEDGLALLERETFDLVIQDMNFRADPNAAASGRQRAGTSRRATRPRAPPRGRAPPPRRAGTRVRPVRAGLCRSG